MKELAPGVYWLDRVPGGNVYVLVMGDRFALIDSGMPGAGGRIVAQLAEGGHALENLQAVVLTHAHSDHTGSARELARRSGARILAHREEAPYVERAKAQPVASSLQRVLIRVEKRALGRRAACAVDRLLEDGESIVELGGLRVIHTPGHTPGSICLYAPERKVLFCGDLLFNTHPLARKRGLRFAVPWFSGNPAQARESARRLLEVPVEVLCMGHGAPILQGAGARIRELLGDTD